jgi:hypothetical protein
MYPESTDNLLESADVRYVDGGGHGVTHRSRAGAGKGAGKVGLLPAITTQLGLRTPS